MRLTTRYIYHGKDMTEKPQKQYKFCPTMPRPILPYPTGAKQQRPKKPVL